MKQTTLALALLLLVAASFSVGAGRENASVHLNARDIPWDDLGSPEATWSEEVKSKANDAAAISEVIRLKTLVGDPEKGIVEDDIRFGVMEIGPGAIYPAHQHSTPEIYYFVSGRAKWKVDDEEFLAEPGSIVYMKSNAIHELEVISEERLVVVWADWAPNGDRSVLNGAYKLLDRVPEQPEKAKIGRDSEH